MSELAAAKARLLHDIELLQQDSAELHSSPSRRASEDANAAANVQVSADCFHSFDTFEAENRGDQDSDDDIGEDVAPPGVIIAPPKLPSTSSVQVAPLVSRAKKKRKKGSGEVEAHRQLLRDQLAVLLGGEGVEFVNNAPTRYKTLRLLEEFQGLGEMEALCDAVAACAHCGRDGLPALRQVLEWLHKPIVDVGNKRGIETITFDIYHRVADHICLSTDPMFTEQAIDMLIEYRFAPVAKDFFVPDAQEYFVRQQHFLNLEYAALMSEALRTSGYPENGVPCSITEDCTNTPLWGVVWQVSLPVSWGDRWHDNAFEGEVRPRGSGKFAVLQGDSVILVLEGGVCVGTVCTSTSGNGHSNLCVKVEQVERLQRLMDGDVAEASLFIGPSKISHDRERAAVYELSKRWSAVPGLQQWLLLDNVQQPAPPTDGPPSDELGTWAALNFHQQQAVHRILSMQRRGGHVNLIQGPPGTGKTAVALRLICNWLENFPDTREGAAQKILVTGFSNIAVDNLALGLQRIGVPCMIRVGRGQTVLTTDTLEENLRLHSSFKDLEEALSLGYRHEANKLEKKMTKELVAAAKVVVATCITAGGDVLSGLEFRQVIFDEAAQASEPASLVPIVKGCEELVMLGDQMQLPPTVLNQTAKHLGLHESLFERLARSGLPLDMLQIQYRMHPAINKFPGRVFYGGLLTDGVTPEHRPAPWGYRWPKPETPLSFEGIGKPDETLEEDVGPSKQNQQEAERVKSILTALFTAGDVALEEIAVISPYAAQVSLLKEILHPFETRVMVATVDSYQGMERDVIICSTVRSCGVNIGFLSDVRRFNVLLTRARRGLIVLGHKQTLLTDPCWRSWLQHVTKLGVVSGELDPEDPEQEPQYVIDQSSCQTADSGPNSWMAFAGDAWQQGPVLDDTDEMEQTIDLAGTDLAPRLLAASQPIGPSNFAATAKDMLLQSPDTGFDKLGRVPIEFQHMQAGMSCAYTALLMMVLPMRGSSLAQATAQTKSRAEALCCVRACKALSEVGLLDSNEVHLLEIQVKVSGLLEEEAAMEATGLQPIAVFSASEPSAPRLVTPRPAAVRHVTPGQDSKTIGDSYVTVSGRDAKHPKQVLLETCIFENSKLPIEMSETGPDHQRLFTASLLMPQPWDMSGEPVLLTGQASTKKEAERICCEKAVALFEFYVPPSLLSNSKKRKIMPYLGAP